MHTVCIYVCVCVINNPYHVRCQKGTVQTNSLIRSDRPLEGRPKHRQGLTRAPRALLRSRSSDQQTLLSKATHIDDMQAGKQTPGWNHLEGGYANHCTISISLEFLLPVMGKVLGNCGAGVGC